MNKFIKAFCLITILSFAVFAQDFSDEPATDKNLSIALKKPKIEKVNINVPKDDKIELDASLKESPKLKKSNLTIPRQSSGDDYNKNEFFVGYSYQNVDRGERDHFHGANVSYVRNITRYIGIKGDFSAAFNNDDFSVPGTSPLGNPFTISGDAKSQLYNFLGGVQVKDNASDNRLKPFAHALAGFAHQRQETDISCSGDCDGILIGTSNFNETHFSAAFGGGLDIKVNDKVDFRAIKFDYNPIFAGSNVENNFRIGIGIVFK